VPSGQFFANAAWLVCAALAHNLIRWTAMLGEITPDDQLVRGPHRAHPVSSPFRAAWSAVRACRRCAPRSNGHGPCQSALSVRFHWNRRPTRSLVGGSRLTRDERDDECKCWRPRTEMKVTMCPFR
jgi:hypothetical protein